MLNTTRWMLVLLASVVLLTGCTREELPEADRDVEAPEQAALSYDSISGTRYYVDFVNGNDENTGLTPNEPWKHSPGDDNATGTAAMATLQPGDEIILKGGVICAGIPQRDRAAVDYPAVDYSKGRGNLPRHDHAAGFRRSGSAHRHRRQQRSRIRRRQ